MTEPKNNIVIGIILFALFWFIALGVWEFTKNSSTNDVVSIPPGLEQTSVKSDVASNTNRATVQPIKTDGTYTVTDKKEKGIDIDVQSKSPFKMTLPTSLGAPITMTLGDNKTIEVIQRDGGEYKRATEGSAIKTAENAKLLAIIEKDPTLSTYVSTDNKKAIFYSYQKTEGDQKQWLFKNWTLYNTQTNKTETVSYEMRNAVVNIDALGNANVYFDDKTALGNRTPDFTIPRPYILDKDATKTDLMWTFDEASHTLAVSFTALASSYPIALDPSVLKTDTVIATFSGKRIYMKSFTCGTSTVAGAGSITYGTVVGADGKCWLDRNLGAPNVAANSTDSANYGYLYQWGRLADGHQITTSGTTGTQSTGDVPGNANFIIGFADWRSTQNNNLWGDTNKTNNVCPVGWHVPTQAQWATVAGFFSPQTSVGAFNSALKLTLAGYRDFSAAGLNYQGSNGHYWSSSPSGADAYNLYFNSGGVGPASHDFRALGFSVRCVKD